MRTQVFELAGKLLAAAAANDYHIEDFTIEGPEAHWTLWPWELYRDFEVLDGLIYAPGSLL
ncbi:hypothetical protein BY996DRAFT_6439759 [Phakopsora pachyrhizi]|nr:hypothetical protein BY996DRAFT_6439759 [Phakopsora pachyrhizi]